jgi:TolB-like protein/class 3 adenylate cyclase/tetratricopeptide (TPR) repeat protein
MAPRTERKLAAILAADVVGYSRLVGDDEAGTIARLKALRKDFIEPLIAEYHGRVVKLMGDGALVEFASAVDAVECAVAIQKGVAEREAAVPDDRRLAFRIGINVGDIIVEDGDILGDGVNVAARLEGLAEPGGICIARNVWNQVKAKLGTPFEPMGEHRVKNIAEPVTVYRVNLDVPGRAPGRRPTWKQRRWQAAAAGVVLLLALGAGGAWYKLRPRPEAMSAVGTVGQAAAAKPALPLPDKPSIAVLPFENLSGDPKQERLAGGLTEDVITDLSRFHELFVIARNSTEVYKGKPVDVRRVALDLGVQYVLEGSLQIDGDHVRITAQLIDGQSGNHVWAERYDRPLDDMFAVQDEVTQKIAGTLAPAMGGVLTMAGREGARRKRPENLQAYENYLLGIEHKHRYTEEDNKKAKELLTKATELDPSFARAYVGLALAYSVDLDNGWAASRQDTLGNMLKALQTALALDPSDGQAHLTLGIYYMYAGNLEQSVAEHDKALNLNPNDADALLMAAWDMPFFGRPEQAAELADRAVRLNPSYPDWYNSGLLLAYFYAKQFDRAVTVAKTTVNPSMWDYVYRPLVYAQTGRKDDTKAAVSDLIRRDPEYSAERWLSETNSFLRDVELNYFLDSNRKAGLPVCATEAQLEKYHDMTRLPLCEQQRLKS